MAQMDIEGDTLRVRFSLFEKVFGLVGDQRIPLSAITKAHAETNGLRAVHGLRAPGLGMPGVRKIGTWRGRGTKTLVSVSHDQPALVLTLRGVRYDAVVIGCANPEGYLSMLPTRPAA